MCEEIAIKVYVGTSESAIRDINSTSILFDPPRSSSDIVPVNVSKYMVKLTF